MKNTFLKYFLAVGAAVFAFNAWAHVGVEGHGHDAFGFVSGLAHPWSGWDHVLAMFAVGIWAQYAMPSATRNAFSLKNMTLLAPITFIVSLLIGAAFGTVSGAVTGVELGVAASVLALGIMMTMSRVLPLWVGLVAVSLFGALHGHAHGAELEGAVWAYMLGMVTSSACLHLMGVGAGVIQQKYLTRAWLTRVVGGFFSVSGVYLILKLV